MLGMLGKSPLSLKSLASRKGVLHACITAITVSTSVFLLAVGTERSVGTIYYVGGPRASDNNPGTASRPFATIQKAATVIKAVDVIRIRTGIYRETVIPANSGEEGKPIVFEPDGNAVVVVSGADPVKGEWTVYKGKIYRTRIALPLTGYNDKITGNETLLANQVFVNGKMMIEARWPNVSNLDDLMNRNDFRRFPKDGLTVQPDGKAILQDPAIPEIPEGWAGGTIWWIGWYIPQTSTIESSSPGQIVFRSRVARNVFFDFYYLTGKLSALDAPGEWFYDGTYLYLWPPDGGVTKNVEVKRRNYAFDLRGKSYITIRNIHIFAATIITDENSKNIVLDGIRAKYISHFVTLPAKDVIYSHSDETGIRLMGPSNVIRNSIIEYSAGHGVVLGGEGCVADNNLIHDVSYGGTYCCAVFPAPGKPTRVVIARNTIFRTGRSAIDLLRGNVEIAYNDIYWFGLLNTDLGAIYSARGSDLTGTRIHHNWIHDAANDKTHRYPVGAGIYLDQNAKPVLIDHNVFWNNHMNDVRLEQAKPPFNRVFNNTMASTDVKFWNSFESYPAHSPDDVNNNIYRASIRPNKPGANDLTAETDPRFVNEGWGGLKFRLRPDSPAIDRGAVIPGVTDEFVGSAPDIGAYEYGGKEWVAGCTLPERKLYDYPDPDWKKQRKGECED